VSTALCARALKLSRDSGALARIHIELGVFRAKPRCGCGEFADVAQAIVEVDAASDVTSTIIGSYLPMRLAAHRGREA